MGEEPFLPVGKGGPSGTRGEPFLPVGKGGPSGGRGEPFLPVGKGGGGRLMWEGSLSYLDESEEDECVITGHGVISGETFAAFDSRQGGGPLPWGAQLNCAAVQHSVGCHVAWAADREQVARDQVVRTSDVEVDVLRERSLARDLSRGYQHAAEVVERLQGKRGAGCLFLGGLYF